MITLYKIIIVNCFSVNFGVKYYLGMFLGMRLGAKLVKNDCPCNNYTINMAKLSY